MKYKCISDCFLNHKQLAIYFLFDKRRDTFVPSTLVYAIIVDLSICYSKLAIYQ